jgi:hypothetical protein
MRREMRNDVSFGDEGPLVSLRSKHQAFVREKVRQRGRKVCGTSRR